MSLMVQFVGDERPPGDLGISRTVTKVFKLIGVFVFALLSESMGSLWAVDFVSGHGLFSAPIYPAIPQPAAQPTNVVSS